MWCLRIMQFIFQNSIKGIGDLHYNNVRANP